MLHISLRIALVVMPALLTSHAAARQYTLDAPVTVDVAYAEAIPVAIQVGPEAPAVVWVELAGFTAELTPQGGGVYAGTIPLAPVPLPPGSYTIVFTAEDPDGAASPFHQRLTIAPPSDGSTPWLPGERPTGGPLTIERLGAESLPADLCCAVSVRIPGAGRPKRFEAFLAGYRAALVNQGDYRYDGTFDARVLLPPATYTLRVEADGHDGESTVAEWAIALTPPADGSTPWLFPVAPTVWEADSLDYGAAIGGEPSTGCAGGHAPASAWGLALGLAIAWLLRRSARGLLLAALVAVSGCGGEAETRSVGAAEALVQVLDEGEGVANEAPLWPLALGHRIAPGAPGGLTVTESWPLGGGARGLLVRTLDGSHRWHELAAARDGLYVVASSDGGRLHRPLFFLPATVRVGMTWRTWARPADAARLDLHPAEDLDASGGYELRVVRVTEHHDALTPATRARIWDIEWKGPVPPTANYDWIEEIEGVANPDAPSRGAMRFLEGVGPSGDVPAFPAVAYGALRRQPVRLDGEIDAGRARVLPAAADTDPSAPRVSLASVARPEAFDRAAIHQLSVLDFADGVWLRFDGNAAGLGYPSAFPGFGGGGGNANLWVASASSGCFTFEGGRLVSGQELGVLADDETCVHAAGALVSASGDAVYEVPFLDFFGRLVPEAVLEGCDGPGCDIGTWPRAVLPGADGDALLLAHHYGLPAWRLYPWRSFDWQQRFELNDLEAVADVDGAALLELVDAIGVSQLVARRLDDGAFGLLARSAVRYGDPTPFGFARLDPDGVVRDPLAYGPVGFGTSFRAGPDGPEIWQVDRGGRVWEWRFTRAGMERRVRARLELAASETPTAAVRLDAARLFVATAGPEPDNVPPATPRLECSQDYCWEQPHPAPPKLWTARLPAPEEASPWEPPPAILGVAVSEDGATVCGTHPGAGAAAPRLVDPPAGLTGAVDAAGRCLSVTVPAGHAAPIWEYTAQLPGTPPFRVVLPAPPTPDG